MTEDSHAHDDTSNESTDGGTVPVGFRRRDVLKTTGALVGVGGVAGCLGDGGDDTDTPTDENDDPAGDGEDGEDGEDGDDPTETSEPTHVGIISSPAGFDDGAFNDLALEGLNAAKEEHDIQIQQIEETDQSRYQTVQSRLAESGDPDYDLIVMVGFQHTQALQTNAEEYPDQNWMLINDHVEQPNVAGYTWANHEMSFQAGVLAGTMTTRELSNAGNSNDPDGKTVGFVGGVDGSLINAFERAYVAGVHWVDDSIEVKTGYAGSYSDPQAGKQVALSQYDQGADIVYHAAADTGRGVFQAAQDQNRFAIGVDSDQSRTLSEYSDVIIGSAVKFINKGTNEVATAVATDSWSDVQGAHVLGLAEDAVQVVLGQDYADQLPDAVASNLEESKQAILDGDVEVPCTAGGCMN